MQNVFTFVYDGLQFLSRLSGLSYVEVNVVVYYLAIPLVYAAIVDKILRRHLLKTILLLVWLVVLLVFRNFAALSKAVFDASVEFLLWFKVVGLDYVQASVVICVVLPILILVALLIWKRKQKHRLASPNSQETKPAGESSRQ